MFILLSITKYYKQVIILIMIDTANYIPCNSFLLIQCNN